MKLDVTGTGHADDESAYGRKTGVSEIGIRVTAGISETGVRATAVRATGIMVTPVRPEQ